MTGPHYITTADELKYMIDRKREKFGKDCRLVWFVSPEQNAILNRHAIPNPLNRYSNKEMVNHFKRQREGIAELLSLIDLEVCESVEMDNHLIALPLDYEPRKLPKRKPNANRTVSRNRPQDSRPATR